MKIDNLDTLVIHKLSKDQYLREADAGRIDGTAIYLTPREDLEIEISKEINESSTDEQAASAKAVYSYVKESNSTNLKSIVLGDKALEKSDGTVTIPVATEEQSGIVKSSTSTNNVAVHEDGTMEVNEVNINKIVQDSGDTLFLASGNSII